MERKSAAMRGMSRRAFPETNVVVPDGTPPPSTSPGPSGASGAVRLRCLARPRCAGPLPRRPAIRWSWRSTWRNCGLVRHRNGFLAAR
ncbi:hypothetical protein C3K23_00150 (plasmid) [Streptomyces sp. 604F]|nr:hypothetical protein C3K23_00150 [Streptomyces sp. 604F]